MAPPGALVRVTRGAEGELVVGPGYGGRGAWLCRDSPRCLDQAARRDAFARALRSPLRPGAVEALRTLLVNSSSTQGSPAQVCEDGGPGRYASSWLHADAHEEEKERP